MPNADLDGHGPRIEVADQDIKLDGNLNKNKVNRSVVYGKVMNQHKSHPSKSPMQIRDHSSQSLYKTMSSIAEH